MKDLKTLKTDSKTFARRCDVTGEGFNKGFIFYEGERYIKNHKDAEKFAIEEGFSSLDEAYSKDAYYYTEWEELTEGDEILNAKGEVIGTV